MATVHASGEFKVPLSSLPKGFKVTSKLLTLNFGYTLHIVYCGECIDDYIVLDPPTLLKWGDSAISVKAIGTGTLVTNNYLPDGSRKRVGFRDTLHMPELELNLLSIIHLSLPGIDGADMLKNRARLLGPDGDLLGYSPFPGDYGELFPLICDVVSESVREGKIPEPVERICAINRQTVDELMRLHAVYGHVHAERMLKIMPQMTQT